MAELFDKRGGFRRLHSFTLATIVQVETLRFCRRFLTFDHREAGPKFYDPKGRQNIIEGSERSATSKDTEMKRTARRLRDPDPRPEPAPVVGPCS